METMILVPEGDQLLGVDLSSEVVEAILSATST